MLPAGHQLGAYRVISPLGSGGMGEVYLAEDTRLHRRVALKVLPAATAEDAVSRKRLLREAQAAATLDHPNICTVYDIGDDGGHSYIAMQYVEGETLAARMRRRPLDMKTALSIAAQVAAALAEAHKQGIIHRDIKPQNVMLTPAGQVKVLDFGLAKLMAPVESGAETATLLTDTSVVAGTVPYMSPEQVRGEPLDPRTDVFSFGTMLYESLSRVHPFNAATAADTMSAILTREPPALVDPATPSELQRILRKCLDKNRDRRYQSMRDLVIDLENVGRDLTGPEERPSDPKVAPPPIAPAVPSRRWAIAALVMAGLAVALGAGWFFWLRPQPMVISPADFVQVTNFPDAASAPAISPDGRMVAFIRGDWFLDSAQIYVKLLPNGEAKQLTNDALLKYGPAFTPDGTHVTYTAVANAETPTMSWSVWSVPVLGGEPTRVLPNAAGLTWIGDRRVLFSEVEQGAALHMGVVTATEDRSAETRIYFPPHERAMAHFSALSPDRKWILVVQMSGAGPFERCQLVPFDGKTAAQPVGPNGACHAAAWSVDGRWMYFSAFVNGTSHLWRQRFPDGPSEQLTFGAVTGEEGVAMAPDGRSLITSVGQAHASLWVHEASGDRLVPLEGSVGAAVVAADNKRAYCTIRGSAGADSTGLAVVDLATGKADRILSGFRIGDFAVSRDERRVVFGAVNEQGGNQIWLATLDRSAPPRRVVDDADSANFGKDGELVYRSVSKNVNHLFRVDENGQHPEEVWDGEVVALNAVSPDGEWAVAQIAAQSGLQTVAVPIHGGRPRPLCNSVCDSAWSIDGRIFYTTVQTPPSGDPQVIAVKLAPGHLFPDVPEGGALDAQHWAAHAGAVVLPRTDILPGPDPSAYVFARTSRTSNLFLVKLR
ncbi:MAG TPA: protein kinase [Vicinamibacterales bacterium]|nr:protein kinase [Vicinamibacterales bacterium]